MRGILGLAAVAALGAGLSCVITSDDNQPTCGPSNCTGCCIGNLCQGGGSVSACGAGGGVCRSCAAGQSCVDGACVGGATCNATNCAGCCVGNVCVNPSTDAACGSYGSTCLDCAAVGQVCSGGACTGGTPTCGPTNCTGCCVGNVCVNPPTDAACGSYGSTCLDCTAVGQFCNLGACVNPQWCIGSTCYEPGGSCDFYDDQDCFNRTQAWWCSPDGSVYLNDCIAQCAPYGMPYACCGYDPTRGDDACLCCAESTCGGFSCHP